MDPTYLRVRNETVSSLLPLLSDEPPLQNSGETIKVTITAPKPGLIRHLQSELPTLFNRLKKEKQVVEIRVEFPDREDDLVLFTQESDEAPLKTTLKWTVTEKGTPTTHTYAHPYNPFYPPTELDNLRKDNPNTINWFQGRFAGELLTYIKLVSMALRIADSSVLDELAKDQVKIIGEAGAAVATFGSKKFKLHFTDKAEQPIEPLSPSAKAKYIAPTRFAREEVLEEYISPSEVAKLTSLIGIKLNDSELSTVYKINMITNWLIHDAPFSEFVALYAKKLWRIEECVLFFKKRLQILSTNIASTLKDVEVPKESGLSNPFKKKKKPYYAERIEMAQKTFDPLQASLARPKEQYIDASPLQRLVEKAKKELEDAYRHLHSAFTGLHRNNDEMAAINCRLICLIAISLKEKLAEAGMKKEELLAFQQETFKDFLTEFGFLLSDNPDDHDRFYQVINILAARTTDKFIALFDFLFAKVLKEKKIKNLSQEKETLDLLKKHHELFKSNATRIETCELAHGDLITPRKHMEEEKKEAKG